MAGRNEFKIPFSGLALGNHNFEIEINDKFFDTFEYSEIKKGNFQIKIELQKQSTMLVLTFLIQGKVHTNCDRCYKEFDLPINGEYKLIVKFGDTQEDSDNDDIITLSTNETEVVVSQLLYEYIILSLPVRRIHPETNKRLGGCTQR